MNISTKSLKRRAELLSHLKATGTVPVLRQKRNDHLGAINKSIDCVGKPSAICAASNDLLFCSDDESQYIYQVTFTFDGVTIHGLCIQHRRPFVSYST